MSFVSVCGRKNLIAGLVGVAAAFAASGAHAGLIIIPLGTSGFQAEFDDSLAPFVDINFVAVVGGNLFIQKSAEFTSFNPISITFRQISPNAVSNIVIDDEIITNSTGGTFTAFNMDVLGDPDVAFDPAATAASGGFSVAPFTNSAFSNANTRFSAFGGPGIPPGGIWFPGVASGQLFIHVNNIAQGNNVFTLVETPVPAPGVLALLGAAALVSRRRRHAS